MHGERRRADALDPYAERLQEEAQVLDHVVGGGVADDRAPSCRAAASSAFSVTVSPRSVSTIGRSGRTLAVDLRVVEPVGRRDLQAEAAQRDHVRLDRAGAEVAAARVRQLEAVHRGAAAGRGT